MTALLALEVRRFLARRLVKVFVLAVALISLITGVAVFFNHQSLTETEIIARSDERNAAIQRCLDGTDPPPGQHIEAYSEDFGYSGPAPPVEARDGFCQVFVDATTRAPDLRYDATDLQDLVFGLLVPFVLLTMVLGASFIGAEWRANTVAVQLTWEPRRVRLLLAKAAVAVVLGAAFYVVVNAIMVAGLLPTVFLRGTTAGLSSAWWNETLGLLGRGAAYAAIAAAFGFALSSIGRNTAAALGVLLAYIAIFEGAFVGNIWPGIRPWLVVGNSIVFLSGESTSDVGGRSVIEAAAILSAYAGGALLLATAWFRRRDVA